MTGSGRPLRFLALLAMLWICGRIAWHWPETVPELVTRAVAPPARAVPQPRLARATGWAPATCHGPCRTRSEPDEPGRRQARQMEARGAGRAAPIPAAMILATTLPAAPRAAPSGADRGGAPVVAQIVAASAYPTSPLPISRAIPARVAGSAWLIARGGRATPFAPQLGGSQAGARLTYALDPVRRIALAGRVSGALGVRQQEAAIGLDWQPTRLPIHVVAEQRIGLAGIRGGAAAGVIGGFGPSRVVGPVELDGYAQAGAIARRGGYVDGAVRLNHPIARVGAARLHVGLGAWGGAQRGAARLDAGPAAGFAVPLAGRTLRLSLEWRERIAGAADPVSGPALAIGTDF